MTLFALLLQAFNCQILVQLSISSRVNFLSNNSNYTSANSFPHFRGNTFTPSLCITTKVCLKLTLKSPSTFQIQQMARDLFLKVSLREYTLYLALIAHNHSIILQEISTIFFSTVCKFLIRGIIIFQS